MAQFNPNDVRFNMTFNYSQVNLVLKGLGKLPFDEVESLYNAIRSASVQSLNHAQEEHAALEAATRAVASGDSPAIAAPGAAAGDAQA